MIAGAGGRYDGRVEVIRLRAPRWIAAGLGVLLLAIVTMAGLVSRAAASTLDVGDQAVVTITARGRGNSVTVRTWDRPSVQVDGDVTSVDRHPVAFGGGGRPLSQPIPPALFHERDGSVAALPPEDFPFAGLRDGPHDVVRIEAPQGTHLVVTVPASTGVLYALNGGGTTDVEGYRGANLVLFQRFGRVRVSNTSTTAFVQMNSGMLQAVSSVFDRVRVRTDAAHVVFEGCRSTQIEATTIGGSVVYDGGSFEPGLARFESQSGAIALGVVSNAQLIGRSGDGKVYTAFERHDASVAQQGNTATATLGSGGALVNALSMHGNVYLYDGSLRTRRTVAPELRVIHQFLGARREAGHPPRLRQRVRARTSAARRHPA
jgi:hypothetical protein